MSTRMNLSRYCLTLSDSSTFKNISTAGYIISRIEFTKLNEFSQRGHFLFLFFTSYTSFSREIEKSLFISDRQPYFPLVDSTENLLKPNYFFFYFSVFFTTFSRFLVVISDCY